MARRIRSHRLKFDRACEHLDLLDRAERGEETDLYVVTYEPQPDGTGHDVRVTKVDEGRISCIIGDCVHNFRSCLDHLMLELARNPTPKYEEESYFPITGPNDLGPTKWQFLLGPIPAKARTIIKDVQPRQREGPTNYGKDLLWRLNELDRIDKHRRLHVVVLQMEGLGVGGPNVSVSQVNVKTGRQRVKAGAELGAFTVSPFDPGKKMNVKLNLSTQITFDKRSVYPDQPVVELLKHFRNDIQDHILTPLAKHIR